MSKRKKTEVRYDFKPGTEPIIISPKKMPRIGIYSGSFDPVHAGHIVFALKSQKVAGLERVYFVPERRPRHDAEPEHYVHRSVMLNSALKPYSQFEVFELPDARLTSSGLARMFGTLPKAEYSLLTTASELLWHEGELPSLYHRAHLIIAVTSHAQMAEVLARLTGNDRPLGNLTFIDIGTERISSSDIRKSLRTGQRVRGVLPSVWRYARKQWLYLPPIHR